ncbi:MAG: S49 family peptidase [Gemmataceae bacterium]|nr:S49 family peptidase [Gemmataceae bacterium]
MAQNPPLLPSPNNQAAPSRGIGCGTVMLFVALVLSLGINVLLCAGQMLPDISALGHAETRLGEKFHSGTRTAGDKVAIVRVEGAIMEGMLTYAHGQIDQAARDSDVKAIVLRVDSPGGSITASDDMLRRLQQLRDGTSPKHPGKPKPMVVSMGSLCASGGYYISMAAAQDPAKPAPKLFAERSCITGSIGVYASLPNARGLADKVGVTMEMIKAGDIKGSGSPFHELTPQERQPWQDMVEVAYSQFVGVVEAGRPSLQGKLTEPLFPLKEIPRYDNKGNVIDKKGGEYTRRRADGGIFTAKQAMDIGLIDAVGPLDDAIAAVAKEAGLTEWRAVGYDKPQTLISALTGADAATPAWPAADLSPKLWYILPQSEPAARVK